MQSKQSPNDMKKLLLSLFCIITFGVSYAQTGHFYSSDAFSSGLISSLCQDRQGSIWIATDYGLNRFDGYKFATYLHNESDTTSLSVNVVVKLFCDRQGRLWVGTNHGLDRFDAVHDNFIHYHFPDGLVPRVSSILQLHDGTIFIGTAGYGAFTIGADDRLKPYRLKENSNFFVHCFEDSNGRMWKSGFDDMIYSWKDGRLRQYHSPLGTVQEYVEHQGHLVALGFHGLMVFQNDRFVPLHVELDEHSGRDIVFSSMEVGLDDNIYIGTRGSGVFRLVTSPVNRLERVDMNAFGINVRTANISTMMFDRRGNLWLGCFRKGLFMLPHRPTSFNTWSFMAQGVQLGTTVSSVCEGDGGMIWVTVQGVGVYGFNQFGRLVAHPSSPEAVEFIFRDRLKRFWIGTDDGLFSYDPQSGRSSLEVTFDCDRFNDMTSDDQGRIYISTFSRGFCVYDPQKRSLVNYNFMQRDSLRGSLCNNWIMGMTVGRGGLLWLATSSGVACFDTKTGSFLSQGWESQLSGVVCFDVCELQSGQLADGRKLSGSIAVGTERGLFLYDRQRRTTEPFPGSEILNDKVICYVVQSNNGDVWCSTSQGIWQRPHDGKSFVGHVNGNGLTQREYLYGVGMHTDNDLIYFGHSDGLTVFNPADVHDRREHLDSIQLSAFLVGEQIVSAGTVINDVQITDRAVSESDYFTLSYLDHTVTLAFSQFNFDNPMNVTFEYRINGGQWLKGFEGQNSYTLNHLQPGTYRVETRARVGDDLSPVKVIIITIRSPWYRSILAYVCYFFVFVLLAAYIFYTRRRRVTEQMNEEKMKFLINATHDIRSPLTLIMGPLEKIKRMEGATQFQKPLDTIERNAQRILSLVNQILDVRKIDKQQMQLRCEQTDLITFVRGICKMFDYNAQENDIQFGFDCGDLKDLQVWIDRSQFDKVVTNLLSNAFKFTKSGGSINVCLSVEGQKALLRVIDTGIGLDPESEKHIFDRFYQGNNSRTQRVEGTGIGLNLCKMIVDLHHGDIEASNRLDGQHGSVFTVSLPLGNSHLSDEEMVVSKPGSTEEDSQSAAPSVAAAQPVPAAVVPPKKTSSHRRILIVDDDEEICHYIAGELSNYYKFSFASNGREGLSMLLSGISESHAGSESAFDLVISDVMMPEMDGFTMLRMIKTNMNINHIPVVMLTSKADVGNRLEGLERGADAFLAKPFSMDELHGIIDNLIQNRQRLKGKFSGAQQQAARVEQPEVKGNDEQLMERIMRSVNKNLGDSDFSVETLTRDVGISRAQLHRKMKEMTGISTSEFIRNIRLEQAARLLREQKINVTQVAYTVGFSNLAHFSTIFRKHFGISPSEYAERGEQ